MYSVLSTRTKGGARGAATRAVAKGLHPRGELSNALRDLFSCRAHSSFGWGKWYCGVLYDEKKYITFARKTMQVNFFPKTRSTEATLLLCKQAQKQSRLSLPYCLERFSLFRYGAVEKGQPWTGSNDRELLSWRQCGDYSLMLQSGLGC